MGRIFMQLLKTIIEFRTPVDEPDRCHRDGVGQSIEWPADRQGQGKTINDITKQVAHTRRADQRELEERP